MQVLSAASALPPIPIIDRLARHARLRPDALAVQFAGLDMSYGQLTARAEAAAGCLWHDWSVRTGDRVAWLGLNHPAQLVLLLALARIGAMLLPLNFRLVPAELAAQLAECSPRHLVHDATWADAGRELASGSGMAAHDAGELLDPGATLATPQAGHARQPILLVYTSGTTSRPKAALHTQGMLMANMAIASAAQAMTEQDRILTVLPLFHVGGLCIQTLPALYAGASVLLHPRFSAEATLECIARQRPTLTLQVPATMKALIDHPAWAQTDLSSLRAVWAGSSLLPAGLVEAFHARGVPVCNVYGATETGPFSIALPPDQARTHVGSCGWPVPGVEVRLANEQQGTGELLVRGPNVVARYWPDQPACDADRWFHTGDLARCADDGSYTVVGRARDLIISGGENIHPAEIEELLSAHPAVAECAAFGLPDADWGEVVVAAVVLRDGAVADEVVLRAYLDGKLARFKLPRRWIWLAALPRTALGKLERKALVALAGPA